MKDLTKKIKLHDFQPAVLGEQVSQILTDAILEGTLKQGEQLLEAELQKQFGISRSPLREAFRDLEKRGLVVIVPPKGLLLKPSPKRTSGKIFPCGQPLKAWLRDRPFQR